MILATQRIRLRDIETTASLAGPANGPPVILLHGFPDDRLGWVRQISALAEAGFRVIAIDQRGCGQADPGKSIRSYAISNLVDDVGAAIGEFDLEQAHLVRHDWGGIVAWSAAIERRPWLDRLVIVNAPHPAVFARFARTHPSQLLKSWYMLLFQIPRVPEWVLGVRDAELLGRVLIGSSTGGAFTAGEIESYRSMWSQPGRIGSMLDWYRAARLGPIPEGRVVAPTLIVWGERDLALDVRMADLSAERCDGVSLARLECASHWPHRDQPEYVNRLLINHLRT